MTTTLLHGNTFEVEGPDGAIRLLRPGQQIRLRLRRGRGGSTSATVVPSRKRQPLRRNRVRVRKLIATSGRWTQPVQVPVADIVWPEGA